MSVDRFNLMAVVPDRRIAITHKLKMLKTNQAIVTAALEKLLANIPATSLQPKAEDDDNSIQLEATPKSETELSQQFDADSFPNFSIKPDFDLKVI